MLIHLDNEYFELIKNETKNIELRLNDEKRRMLRVGDVIEFENRKDKEKIYCKIIKLHYAEIYPTINRYHRGRPAQSISTRQGDNNTRSRATATRD